MTDETPVDVISLGCRLNLVESDIMQHLATQAYETTAAKPLTIINSCAVTADAVRQTHQAIRRIARTQPDREIIVTGCAAEIDPAAFMDLPQVKRIIPNQDKTKPNAWGLPANSPTSPPRLETRTRAFLEIQNGCDHSCTFCTIPLGRGPSRSRTRTQICQDIDALLAQNVPEIVLTGVDLTSWQEDDLRLGDLVMHILNAAPSLPRLRLSSLDCIEMDPRLLHALTTEQRLMPHVHLSLQAGDDLILKRMKRRHSRDQAIALCQALHAARPEIVLGADFIVGFPTETREMFAQTCALVEECGLTHLHVFPFSPRPGTPAARMPQIDSEEIKERADQLRALGTKRRLAHLDTQVGRIVKVLAERNGKGKTADFTPIHLPIGYLGAAGDFFDLHVTHHDGQALFGSFSR